MTIFTEKLNSNHVKIVLNYQQNFLFTILDTAQMSSLSIQRNNGQNICVIK